MKEIKKFGVLSVGKVFAVIGFIMTVLQVILLAVVFAVDPTIALQYGIDASQFGASEIAMNIVVVTFVYFVVGLFSAFVYNLVVKYTGGINVDLDEARVRVARVKVAKVKSKKKK
ncbi:MAG: hypothetical protein KJ592_03430 [Nanoarchaeota archaeon]|nr:hypothetical protein [Nanoarchaeota archaeon]